MAWEVPEELSTRSGFWKLQAVHEAKKVGSGGARQGKPKRTLPYVPVDLSALLSELSAWPGLPTREGV